LLNFPPTQAILHSALTDQTSILLLVQYLRNLSDNRESAMRESYSSLVWKTEFLESYQFTQCVIMMSRW